MLTREKFVKYSSKILENNPEASELIPRSEAAMSWRNYAGQTAISVTLMVACFMVGSLGWSFLWICIFAALHVMKTHMFIRREDKRMRLRQIVMREREVVMAQLEDLPAWVQFPDTERIEWVNKVLLQLWPYIGEYAGQFMREFIEPQVRAQMPAPFRSFKFLKIDMGDLPCRVGGLKVYTHNVGRDKIIVDMDVVYAGDADFTVQACGFVGGLNQLVVSGKLRCVCQPLLPYPPMIGGISASFIEMPKFDFNLTGMGEFAQLPGLITAIRSIVNSQVAALCVLPNKIVVPLAPNVDVTKLYFPEPDGVIRLKIIEARNLENRDISFLHKGKSDPYCEIQVGSQIFRTRTINNDLNPIFNEHFEAVVDQASGQKLRIELFDEDSTGSDEELGRLSIPLDMIRQAGVLDRWFHLEGCKHGELHIKVNWLNLSTEAANLERDQWETEWLTADKPIHPAMVMVFVDNVSDLPYPKANLEPSPLVEVTLGKESQRTPVKVKTVNPLFQNKFSFFVRQPEGQELKICALDDGTKRNLGDLSIPLRSLMNQPNLECFQQTFYLTHGVHTSPIVLTVRLRFFAPVETINDGNLDHTYGNAKHIERADKPPVPTSMHTNGNGAEMNITKLSPGLELSPEHSTASRTPDSPAVDRLRTINKNGSSLSISSKTEKKPEAKLFDKLRAQKHEKIKNDRDAIRPENYGQILVSMRYDEMHNKLEITVHEVKDLIPVERNGEADPYVSVRLIATSGSPAPIKKRTGKAFKTLNPHFDNQISFDVHYSDLHNYRLQLIVKDDINYGVLKKAPVLGQVEFSLQNFDRSKMLNNHWETLNAPPN
ncbi:hypothetical protein QR680_014133 [Steinernema hermaphroditum]|uniref:Extended synaptotagmin-2 n=1 Tax=Steinernema hermaphroditum TaxID=289476 RepID=A0AA39M3I7_9BILA|nr:hypothetical protein QR680_014133 [Steinernema hermaphroditum]